MEKNIGDVVWLDGYTPMAQQNSQKEVEVKDKDYKFDEKTGNKFPIYLVNNMWFDSRDGSVYNNDKSMYYIEL